MLEWLGVGCPTQTPRLPTKLLFVYGVHSLKESHAHQGGGCVPSSFSTIPHPEIPTFHAASILTPPHGRPRLSVIQQTWKDARGLLMPRKGAAVTVLRRRKEYLDPWRGRHCPARVGRLALPPHSRQS